MVNGGCLWALEVCEQESSVGAQHLWVGCCCRQWGGRLCGVTSVGSRGHLCGGHFHPSESGRGHSWLSVCAVIFGHGQSWSCGLCSFLWAVIVHGSSLLREGWWWVMVVFLSLSSLIVPGCGCSFC